jgi:hypothetical protein
MEGNNWTDNGGTPNNFTSSGNTNNYCPFDLYLMGFLDPALTPSTFYISGPSADTNTATVYAAGSTPIGGASVNGTRVNVTVTQLQNALGPRVPDFTASQKDFKVAFVLVVANGATATDPASVAALNAAVSQLNTYRTAWGPYWNAATGGASTMDTSLATGRAVDLYVRDNLGDDGTTPSVGSLSQSPDIIVRKSLIGDVASELGDPTASPVSHKVEIGNDNYVYVRVHNRGSFPADADVEVFYAALTTTIDPATWTSIGTTTVPTVVPNAMSISDPITWVDAPDPGGAGHFCLIAVIDDPLDPKPDFSTVTDTASYLTFVRDNNNVAYRNLTFENVLPDSDSDTDVEIGSFGTDHRARFVIDATELPRGFVVEVVLPGAWRRLRFERKGFRKQPRGSRKLEIRAGSRAELKGVLVKARSRHRVQLRISTPKDAPHRARGRVAFVHFADKEELGRVELGLGVIDRAKACYLGVRRSRKLYLANDKRVARLANDKLQPFEDLAEALRWSYRPAPGSGLVELLGPRAVPGVQAKKVLENLRAIRSAHALVKNVGSAAFSEAQAEALLAHRKERGHFERIEAVAEAPAMTREAFAKLVDTLG